MSPLFALGLGAGPSVRAQEPAPAEPAKKEEPAPPVAPPAAAPAADPVKVEKVLEAELKFPEKYPEAPGIFLTVSKANPEFTVTKAELVKVWDAAAAPMESSEGSPGKAEGAHAEKALQGEMEGILMWGPYQELEAGVYYAVFRFRLDNAPRPGSILFLDVCHKTCTTSGERLAAEKLEKEKWLEVAVPFYLPVKKPLEYRFWPGGNVVSVDRVYVYKLEPGKRAKPEPGTIIPLGIPIPNRPQNVLSPHDRNAGMIDAVGYLPGTTIRCPYSRKMFIIP